MAGDDLRIANTLKRIYTMFKNAPDLGSLIDPTRLREDNPLYNTRYGEVKALLDEVLESGDKNDKAATVFGEAARDATNTINILLNPYHL